MACGWLSARGGGGGCSYLECASHQVSGHLPHEAVRHLLGRARALEKGCGRRAQRGLGKDGSKNVRVTVLEDIRSPVHVKLPVHDSRAPGSVSQNKFYARASLLTRHELAGGPERSHEARVQQVGTCVQRGAGGPALQRRVCVGACQPRWLGAAVQEEDRLQQSKGRAAAMHASPLTPTHSRCTRLITPLAPHTPLTRASRRSHLPGE